MEGNILDAARYIGAGLAMIGAGLEPVWELA